MTTIATVFCILLAFSSMLLSVYLFMPKKK